MLNKMTPINKKNNIELLRFIFALQVMAVHLLEDSNSELIKLLGNFPGVPAFFFISGLLIYASYANSKTLGSYAANRFLRIFPGLFFVTVGGLLLVLIAKGQDFIAANIGLVIGWTALQLTIGQGYNPSLFCDIGVGAINGVLWTITVEILFYTSVPIIYFLESKSKLLLPLLAIISFIIYSAGADILSKPIALGKSTYDFMNLTPIVWGWMFILGIYAYKYLRQVNRYSKYFYLASLPMFALAAVNDDGVLFASYGNRLGIIYMVLYCLLIIFLAFETRPVKINFDISYGVYIWHMVVLNFAITLNLDLNFISSATLTIAIALTSWYFIEKPSLRLKTTSIMRNNTSFIIKKSADI